MGTIATITAKEVFELLQDDLAGIEQEFGRNAVSEVRAITDIGNYLKDGGGKRLRPALLLLSAKLFGYTGRSAVKLGSVVEIIHTATLVHDDIIDEAETRRGRPSANTQWGNAKCVLAGDWLYMQAFKVALEERNFHILDLLIALTQQMVEGELLQMEKLGRCINEQEYLDLIFRKTACLFSVSMRLGGVLAGRQGDDQRRVGASGWQRKSPGGGRRRRDLRRGGGGLRRDHGRRRSPIVILGDQVPGAVANRKRRVG